jgi:hypothetical protein
MARMSFPPFCRSLIVPSACDISRLPLHGKLEWSGRGTVGCREGFHRRVDDIAYAKTTPTLDC